MLGSKYINIEYKMKIILNVWYIDGDEGVCFPWRTNLVCFQRQSCLIKR